MDHFAWSGPGLSQREERGRQGRHCRHVLSSGAQASHPLPIRGGGMGQGGVASVPVPTGQGQSEGRCAVPDVLPLPAGPPAPPLGSAGTVARVLGAGALTSQVWARRLLACTVALAGSLVCVLDSKPGENAHSGLPAHQRVSRGWLTRWHVGMPSNVYSIEQR